MQSSGRGSCELYYCCVGCGLFGRSCSMLRFRQSLGLRNRAYFCSFAFFPRWAIRLDLFLTSPLLFALVAAGPRRQKKMPQKLPRRRCRRCCPQQVQYTRACGPLPLALPLLLLPLPLLGLPLALPLRARHPLQRQGRWPGQSRLLRQERLQATALAAARA